MSDAYPGNAQFEQLRDAFVARMKPVVDDASENRVRSYDRDPQADPVKMLDFVELRDAISYSERLMNDLSMVGRHNEHDHRQMNTPDAADVVPDMVDAILLGPPEQIKRVRDGLDRIAFYDELHHRQAKEPSQYFNDKLFSSLTAAAVSADPTPPRYVGFFPALPLARNLELGESIVGTPPDTTQWASRRFQDLSQSLVRSFEKVGFKGGAMLLAPRSRFRRIEAAGRCEPGDPRGGHVLRSRRERPPSSDRAERRQQALGHGNVGERRFVHPADRRRRRHHAPPGRRPQEHTRRWAQDTVASRQRSRMQCSRLGGRSRYRTSSRQQIFEAVGRDTHDGRTITTAAEWHRFAMSNPLAITSKQRIVAIKTAFEALLGTSESRPAAHRLRVLFETATRGHHSLLPWTGLFWSPRERVEWRWEFLKKEKTRHLEGRSELERWFMALARVRNLIIHEGKLVTETYEAPADRPLSRYAGALVWVGERVLREAIKATIGAEVLLCGALARRELAEKAFGDLARQLVAVAKERAAAGTEPEPAVESTFASPRVEDPPQSASRLREPRSGRPASAWGQRLHARGERAPRANLDVNHRVGVQRSQRRRR